VTSGGIVNIPAAALSEVALLGVIDDYINREGTDYGPEPIDLAQKRLAIKRELDSGRAMITYDTQSQTTTIVPVPGTRRQ